MLAFSFFVQEKLNQAAPLVGIPVFPNRSFRHRSIYCSDAAGIKKPADLKGERVGLQTYTGSSMSWVRGLLHDEFGVLPQDIKWFTFFDRGTEAAKASGVSIMTLPPPGKGIGLHLYCAKMVERGELDAAITPMNVTRPGITRLFPNFADLEAEYYRRTGIFPIIHTVVLNERIVREHPWVPGSLIEAFRKSAALTPRYVADVDCVGSDIEVWELDRHILGGDDPYACGMGINERRSIEAFLDYLVMDGAIGSKPRVDWLFHVG